MRNIYITLHFCLSLLFITTPILGLNYELNYQAQEEITCCVDMTENSASTAEIMSCHAKDDTDKSCKDSCKDKCQDHAAPVVTHTVQPPTSNTEVAVNDLINSLKISTYFQNLFQQQFIPQFWNPPKHV